MCNKIMTFAMALLLTAGFAAHAQQGNNELYGHPTKGGGTKSITFPASNIQFWTGQGTNQAVYILAWDDDPNGNDLALAWGVRWNGTATATSLLDTIAAYDNRFSYTLSSSLITNMAYNDGTVNPGSSMNGWCYYHNGSWGQNAWPNEPVANNDVIEMSSSCSWTMTTAQAATNPNPSPTDTDTNATITASDITYWVGEGNSEVVFVVNWPDTALAWGFRYDTTATVLDAMDAIAAADPRFSYVSGSYGIDDILFVENGDTLRKAAYSWWEHTVNNVISMGAYQQLNDGDFSRWADPTVGVVIDSTYDTAWGGYWIYTYAYPQAITPVSAPAPQNATISADDITYWVGEGNFEVIFAVNWPDTALAWGYHFSGRSTNLQQVMNAIADADPRVRFVAGSYGIDDILFIENGDTLHKAPYSWWEHTFNGQVSAGLSQQLNHGDFSRWADPTAGVVVDSTYDSTYNYWYYTYAYPQEIHPVTAPTPQNATISADDIRFWVGEGANRIIFAVNWVDTALAWGFRYDTTATVLDAMDAIAAADPRFSYVTGSFGIDDILFVENGDTLRKATYSWWEHSINGSLSMGAYQSLSDGDFSRWADPMAGVLVDSVYDSQWDYWTYIYAYPRRIYPAHNPNAPVTGPFCGAVGTEGCTAVKFDDQSILDWARSCTIVRGSQNLSDSNASLVTYGTEADAVGPATANTMDVVSLGDGGSATLTFARPIRNGEGYDFAIFENSFNDFFLELAFVEVSTDGETFVRFPATSLTQTDVQIGGTGSVDPTYINNLAGKYRVGYGTPFDLDELRDSTGIDLENINYVRIIDVVGSIDPALGTHDAFGHMVNDPFPTISYSAGFDLDGVAVLNQNYSGIDEAETTRMEVYPNPVDSRLQIVLGAPAAHSEAALYDMTGRKVYSHTVAAGSTRLVIATDALPGGVYLLRLGEQTQKIIIRH